MPVSIHIIPSDQMLLAELASIKDEQPGIGIQRLSGQVHVMHPDWRVNAKRVRKVSGPYFSSPPPHHHDHHHSITTTTTATTHNPQPPSLPPPPPLQLLKAHGLVGQLSRSPDCIASPLELSQSAQSDNSEEAAEKDLSSSICSNASASGDDQDRGLERSAAASSFILNAEARGSGFVVVEEKAPAAKAGGAAEAEAEEMAMGAMDDEEWVLC